MAKPTFDWDDLRHFLAIARGGSLSAAARDLGVNHSTVFRRLGGLEAALGVRLFDRQQGGYGLTEAGEEMLAHAANVEEGVLALGRAVAGRDYALSGVVRVTAPDTLGLGVLPRHLAGFRAAYPGIRLELIISNEMFSLSQRQADVAIRPTGRPEGDMIGRRLCDLAFAVYGAPAYMEVRGRPADAGDLAGHDLIGADGPLAGIAAARWLAARAGGTAPMVSCNSLPAQAEAARAGLGLAALPCFLADPVPGLERVLPPDPEMASGLWLLTHRDLRRSARIRAFLDFMAAALSAERARFEGRAATKT